MSTMIQIRNVPDEVHRQVKARAAEAGMSLSDYLLGEIRRSLEVPSQAELRRRIAAREPVELTPEPWEVIRELRDSE